jgi:hypothetical protein
MARSQIHGAIFPAPVQPSEGQQKEGKEQEKRILSRLLVWPVLFRTLGEPLINKKTESES